MVDYGTLLNSCNCSCWLVELVYHDNSTFTGEKHISFIISLNIRNNNCVTLSCNCFPFHFYLTVSDDDQLQCKFLQ